MSAVIEVKIPHSGSVQNVEITEWIAGVGDVVAEGDVLAEVSTDKVDTELESPAAGKVAKLLFEEGDEVEVGTLVALIVDPALTDDDLAAALAPYEA